MSVTIRLLTALLLAAFVGLAACGGGDDDGENGSTSSSDNGGDGGGLTEADARTLISASLLTPDDLEGEWTIMSDTSQTNEEFAAARPELAGQVEQCGRLFSRTVVNFPADVLNAFIGGETLAFFSQATAYATADGAATCAEEAATRLAEPGALAREFGTVFVNPEAVVVETVDYPQTADGSFAATLTGQINAQGNVVDITILIVAFRDGNVSAVVGSARSGSAPPTDELTPLVDLVLSRIRDNR